MGAMRRSTSATRAVDPPHPFDLLSRVLSGIQLAARSLLGCVTYAVQAGGSHTAREMHSLVHASEKARHVLQGTYLPDINMSQEKQGAESEQTCLPSVRPGVQCIRVHFVAHPRLVPSRACPWMSTFVDLRRTVFGQLDVVPFLMYVVSGLQSFDVSISWQASFSASFSVFIFVVHASFWLLVSAGPDTVYSTRIAIYLNVCTPKDSVLDSVPSRRLENTEGIWSTQST